MSNLPNIDDFKSFKIAFNDSVNYSTVKTVEIDLEAFYLKLKTSREELKNKNLTQIDLEANVLEYKLFELDFLRSINKRLSGVFDKYLGYSKKYDSLSISIFDEFDKVQTIAIRTAKDKEGNLVKWKSYGLKSYVPYKLDYEDNFVFFAVGMAEYLLFELIDVSYILLQSDSMYRYIAPEVIEKVKNKQIIIFKENDESFEKLIVKLNEIFVESNIFIIDFEKVLNKKLSKGFDLRDLCNEINNLGAVEQLIEDEIMKQIKKEK
ncbi:MAG: hypothetical protein ACEQSQ_10625 [Candidatus Paceibacteria bacterium]